MKIKTVIVDDEQVARDVLENYLNKYCPVVEIVGKAQHIKEAVPLIHELQPQLVFLDVEMPYGNAFDVLEACQDVRFETIFVTAYSEYSLKALNRSAAYYLLKPIEIAELVAAVNKVQESVLRAEEFNRNTVILQNLHLKPGQQQIVLPTLQGFDVVKTESITRLVAKGNFTEVHFSQGPYKLICKFLKHFDEILDPPFIRVHRSYIVNSNFVKSYSKAAGGYLIMTDGEEIAVSESYKSTLLSHFGAL